MSDEVAFRPIEAGDIEGLHAALDTVARERVYLAMLVAPPLDSSRRFVEESIAAGGVHQVAIAGGRVAGWCDIQRGGRETTAHGGVPGLGLLPGFRGRGVGRGLMASTLDRARAGGMSRVELTVRADNHRAIALYERLGFGHEGVRRRALRIDEAFHDVVAMALLWP